MVVELQKFIFQSVMELTLWLLSWLSLLLTLLCFLTSHSHSITSTVRSQKLRSHLHPNMIQNTFSVFALRKECKRGNTRWTRTSGELCTPTSTWCCEADWFSINNCSSVLKVRSFRHEFFVLQLEIVLRLPWEQRRESSLTYPKR